MKMIDISGSLRRISADLGLDAPYVKGETIRIHNCWHFSTDGESAEYMFIDDNDFVDGMNRIYTVARSFKIVILAFCLMDNHIHFVLWGDFDECSGFVHEFVRRTSMQISNKYGDRNKLKDVPINFQAVNDDTYLKTVICYVIKNPPQAGLRYTAYDYPWSSGSLYLRNMPSSLHSSAEANWTSAQWLRQEFVCGSSSSLSARQAKSAIKTNEPLPPGLRMIGRMIFPGEYVAADLVNRIYKSHRSFNFFMCVSKESDVETRGGQYSRLNIPNQEMRMHKAEVCKELFGVTTVRSLSTDQRLRLVRTLRSRFNSSPKQLVKMCGLKYDEVKDLL